MGDRVQPSADARTWLTTGRPDCSGRVADYCRPPVSTRLARSPLDFPGERESAAPLNSLCVLWHEERW